MGEVEIRSAQQADAEALARLMAELGYPLDVETARERLRLLLSSPADAILSATLGGEPVGIIGTHVIPLLHRDGILGRITAFVVASEHRGRGIGAQLLRAAEAHLWAQGCERIEVTSGHRRLDAHRFYEREGYQTESKRFLKYRSATSRA